MNNIDDMAPGPEMDRVIATQVRNSPLHLWADRIGQPGILETYEGCVNCERARRPATEEEVCITPYSTDIASAWTLVEDLERRGRLLGRVGREFGLGGYLAQFFDGKTYGHACEFARGETAPLAICRAAWKAVQQPVSKSSER